MPGRVPNEIPAALSTIREKVTTALRTVEVPADVRARIPYGPLADAALTPVLDALPSQHVMVERLAWHLFTEGEDMDHSPTAEVARNMWTNPRCADRRAGHVARAQRYLDVMLTAGEGDTNHAG